MSRILIVDDEDGHPKLPRGHPRRRGLRRRRSRPTATARSRALAAGAPPDLVLLDIAMPGRDGVEILAEVRERWSELPVVMMSGHGTIETAVRTTRLGAFDFIEKPLSIDKLLLTIEHALERSRLERENARLRAESLRANDDPRRIRAHRAAQAADRAGRAHATVGCSSPARTAPARSWSRARSTSGASARTAPSSR